MWFVPLALAAPQLQDLATDAHIIVAVTVASEPTGQLAEEGTPCGRPAVASLRFTIDDVLFEHENVPLPKDLTEVSRTSWPVASGCPSQAPSDPTAFAGATWTAGAQRILFLTHDRGALRLVRPGAFVDLDQRQAVTLASFRAEQRCTDATLEDGTCRVWRSESCGMEATCERQWEVDRRCCDPPPSPARAPLVLEATTTPWRIVVPFAQTDDTSEDWNYFQHDIQTACRAQGVASDYLQKGQRQVQVRRAGALVATVDLPPEVLADDAQGYFVLVEGGKHALFGHNLVDEILPPMSKALGVSLRR